MKGRTRVRTGTAAGLLAAVATMLGATAAGAMPVYNNLPKRLPGNVPSIGFEATSTSQFGSLVELSRKRRGRSDPRVTFTLSDWACQSGSGETCTTAKKANYTWPITVDLYEVGAGNTVGGLIASRTQTVTVPYRPSASPECAREHPGDWYEKKTKECFSGFVFKETYSFTGVTLPSELIVGIAYDTENYGAEPTGTPGPENSLNVGLVETAATTGSNPLPEDVFVDSTWSEMYCEGAKDVGTFGDSGACWAPYQTALEIKAE